MKFRYILPFLLFGVSFAFPQEKDTVFRFFEHEKNVLYGKILKSKKNGSPDVLKVYYDIHPKNGVVDLNAYFYITKFDSANLSMEIDSTAFMIMKDYNEDGKANLVLGDEDGNGTLEKILFESKPQIKGRKDT
ncbi:MAG: hypothetical protein KKB62_03710 [Nanoarchaeota archaeon]|nr:hypothetical protein [Nanoarchaeota archaeon]